MDGDSAAVAIFDCGDKDVVQLRFVSEERAEIMLDGDRLLLDRQRSASGAKYANAGVEFWNKGDAALLRIGGVSYDCSLMEKQ